MSDPRIHPLSSHLANQVAAGEVIERPASVLKELVENCIDAQATHIQVTVEQAGNKKIAVQDNGIGIHPDDLVLAASRHATSKLSDSEQLQQLSSLGFRGEALSSIAAVSQLTITSRQNQQEYGWQYSNDTRPTPCQHPIGTTVMVQDLFFNVPARRRFLRSDKTELQHITTTLHRLMLSQFDIAFTCQLGNHQRISLPIATNQAEKQQRIVKLCGRTFIKQSLYIEQQYQHYHLTGWLANHEGHRPNTDIQFFFINGRIIRDKVIQHAIRQAYFPFLPEGRHAAYILFLTMPFDALDINVHPTKHEARFHQPRLIHALIHRAIDEALSPAIAVSTANDKDSNNDVQTPLTNPPSVKDSYSIDKQQTIPTTILDGHPIYQANNQTIPSSKQQYYQPIHQLLHHRFALINDDTPQLIDLYPLNRCLIVSRFKQAISNNALSTRPILVPITIDIDTEHAKTLETYQAQLSSLGFAYRYNAHQSTMTITQIPSLLASYALKSLASELINHHQHLDCADNFITHFITALPQPPIRGLEQANQLWQDSQQLQLDNLHQAWWQELDIERLSALFTQNDKSSHHHSPSSNT